MPQVGRSSYIFNRNAAALQAALNQSINRSLLFFSTLPRNASHDTKESTVFAGWETTSLRKTLNGNLDGGLRTGFFLQTKHQGLLSLKITVTNGKRHQVSRQLRSTPGANCVYLELGLGLGLVAVVMKQVLVLPVVSWHSRLGEASRCCSENQD